MIVFTTTASQTLTIIPREYLGSFYVKFRDTSLNKTFSYFEDTTTTSGDYLSFTGGMEFYLQFSIPLLYFLSG